MRGSLETDAELLANIQAKLPELTELLEEINSHWVYEDRVHRFYHQSFKVYDIQDQTKRIVEALRSVAPSGASANLWFEEIYQAGASGKKFEMSHNKEWTVHTRVLLEAFLHAKYFLEMAVKYGKELKEAPEILPSGWASLLYFYNIR
jgi:hypothetical protein